MSAPKQRHDGEGTVFKTVSNGQAVFYAQETFRDATGQRRYITGTGKTPAEAMKRRAANRVKRLNRLQQEEGKTPTLAEYVESYLLNRQGSLSPESLRKYRRDFEIHLFPQLGKTRLGEITVQQLDKIFHSASSTLGESAKWHVYTNLNALFNHSVKFEVLEKNPLRLVSKPKKVSKVAREDAKYINARVSAATNFLKWLSNEDTVDASTYTRILLMFLGLRRAEILGLEWDCINQLKTKGKATLVIRQQLKRYEKHEAKTGWYLHRNTKSKEDRVIYLPEVYRLALVEVKKLKRVSASDDFKDVIFLTPEGKPTIWSVHDRSFKKLYETYLNRSKNPQSFLEFRPHYARHIAASFMLEQGISIEAIQSVLGHSEAAMALHYAHLTKEAKQGAAEATIASIK